MAPAQHLLLLLQQLQPKLRKVPKGWSEYQAAWILDEDADGLDAADDAASDVEVWLGWGQLEQKRFWCLQVFQALPDLLNAIPLCCRWRQAWRLTATMISMQRSRPWMATIAACDLLISRPAAQLRRTGCWRVTTSLTFSSSPARLLHAHAHTMMAWTLARKTNSCR